MLPRKTIPFPRFPGAAILAIFALAVVMSDAAPAIAAGQSLQTPDVVEKLVNVGPYSLNFRIIPGKGPAILLESGGGWGAIEWATLAPLLARETGATVIAYDRAGFGKSDLPETPYDLHEDTEALWRGLRQLGLDQNLILVGHSFGGFLIRFEAGEHPGSVKGLVFIDPFTVEFVDAMGIEACNNHPMMGKLPFDASNPEKLSKYQRALVRMVGVPDRNLAKNCAAVRKTTLPRGLPVRVITSGKTWLPPGEQKLWRESHDRFTASIEGAKLLVAEHSNHMIPLVQPDLVVSVVKDVAGLAFSIPASAGQESNPFLGAWTGSLSLAGATLDFTIAFRLDENSQVQGTIDIPAQGAASIPLGSIKTEGNKISFIINDPGAHGDPVFKGEMDGTGKKIAGSFSQSGYEGTFSMEKK